MKRALAFALLIAGSPLDAGEIVQKPLDEFVIYNIPVAFQSGNTTVLFPSAISGLYAKSVAVQEQSNADFVLSFTPGNFYFTVRALKKDAEDHLTVIFNRKAMSCISRLQPFYSVTFFKAATPAPPRGPWFPSCFRFWTRRRLIHFSRRTTRTRWLASSTPRPTPRITTTISGWSLATCGASRRRTLIFRIDLENTSDSTIY